MTPQCGFYSVSPSVRHMCYFHTSFVTAWLMSDITKHSPPLLLFHSTPSPLQHQGPPSPDPAARHSPYRCHSSESLDYLSGLMPKALSPTPYVPIGAGSTAGAVSGPSLTAVSSASISGCVSPSTSPVTVSALSHYSSSTAGLLDELQICSLDSPGASPTPSPTLSHVSTYTSTAGLDDVLTATVASTAAAATFTNVIIPSIRCRNTCHCQNQGFPLSSGLFGRPSQNVVTTDFLPFTNSKLQPTCQIHKLHPAHLCSFIVSVFVLETLSTCACLCFSFLYCFCAIQCLYLVS